MNGDTQCKYQVEWPPTWCNEHKQWCTKTVMCNEMKEHENQNKKIRESINNGIETAREIRENCNKLRNRAWKAEGELETLRKKYDALRSSFIDLNKVSAEKTVVIREQEIKIEELKETITRYENETINNVLK